MNLEKFLDNKYVQIKQLFIYGITISIAIVTLNTIYALFTGNYPTHFSQFILTCFIVVGYCINSFICLKTHKHCKKIPWSWIGVLLSTITLVLLLLVVWSQYQILTIAIGALAITLTYTSAIIPFEYVKERKSSLYNAIVIAHRVVTPIFGIMLMIDFCFNIQTSWVLQLTYSLLLIEIFLVITLSLLYIFPKHRKIVIFATDRQDLYRDRAGNLYLLTQKEDSSEESEKEGYEEDITL